MRRLPIFDCIELRLETLLRITQGLNHGHNCLSILGIEFNVSSRIVGEFQGVQSESGTAIVRGMDWRGGEELGDHSEEIRLIRRDTFFFFFKSRAPPQHFLSPPTRLSPD